MDEKEMSFWMNGMTWKEMCQSFLVYYINQYQKLWHIFKKLDFWNDNEKEMKCVKVFK